MTGIAEVAAIFGIIAGVGSAVRLVIDLRKTYEKRKKGKSRAIQAASSTIEQRLKRLEDQLRSSEPALKQEYTRLGLRPEEIPNDAFRTSLAILGNIMTGLQQIRQVSPDDAMIQPERLRLHELEQLSNGWRLEVFRTLLAIRDRSQQEEGPMAMTRVLANGNSELTCNQPNKRCENAILYQLGLCRFDDVAATRPHASGIQEWACKLCGRVVSRASLSMSLAQSNSDQVYVTPAGFFKAHAIKGNTEVWSCIWQRRSEECSKGFIERREFLQHLSDLHVRTQPGSGKIVVDMAADNRDKSVAKCGYGIRWGGREMTLVDGQFIVDS